MAENQNMQPTQVIAKIFGVSTRRVEQLKSEGVIKGQGRPTKYDLLPTIQAYIRYLSDKANGREKKAADAELESKKLDAESRFKQAKAEMAELSLQELQGKLHRAEDVEAITNDSVLMLRSQLMGMPGKLAVDCANARTAPQAAEIIKKEVYRILNDMANYQYDPEKYKQRVRERQGWDEQHADAEA